MSDNLSYTTAFEELQKIVSEIEQGKISVDELSEKVKRAAQLIKVCKSKLTSTEEDVNKILKELDSPGDEEQQS
ncbi:MAG: exodeoxyribonuclease VII small subunit [Prevotellaceae bacterium]|jgi:exodeoxyribonuclease VII small subunit|nr:exodeoxyribonuclease VII small subunit [Prevotellaceae bacterium]